MIDAHTHAHAGSSSSAAATADHERLHSQTPDAAIEAAISALRAAGERVTGSRRAVLSVLADHVEHLSADQVAAIVESAPRPAHRATVYRALDKLTEIGVVTSMHIAGGATVFHLASTATGNDHLHGRCRVCGVVAVIPSHTLEQAAREITASTGFRLEPAQSTLVGRCAACA